MRRMFQVKYIAILMIFSIALLYANQPNVTLFNAEIEVGLPAPKDLIASKSVTYVDEIATQQSKEEALKEVKNVYDQDLTVFESQKEELKKFISNLIKSKIKYDEAEDKKAVLSTINNPYNLSIEEMELLINITTAELTRSLDYVTSVLEKLYKSGIREDNLETAKETLTNDSNLYLLPSGIRVILVPKIKENMVVNETLNKEETDKQMNQTLSNVQVVYKKIQKDEVIARQDDIITEEQYQALSALDMTSSDIAWGTFFRAYPSVLMFLLIFHLFCVSFLADKFLSIKNYLFTLTTITGVVLFSNMIHGIAYAFIPYITALIVFAVFWGRTFIQGPGILMGYLTFGDDHLYMMICVLITLCLSFLYHDFRRFTDAIKTSTLIGLIISLAHFILFFTFEDKILIEDSIQLIGTGILAGIIANGLIPLIENFLGMATIYKLTELNKYDHPILEELYRKAKGTYDHSRNVSHLCSSASNRIGTNTLLLKVASLYHDIGKMDKPEYYIENSNPDHNIHDTITPLESAEIIIGHALRSVQLCRKHNIPKEVIDLIETHHGDTKLLHFYQKALEQGMDVSIEQFQYPTPTPKSKEQGILMLADSVEAYSRQLHYPSKDELEKQIRTFIFRKAEQGALRDCLLSVKDIEICIEEFTDCVYATRHQRIPYSTDKVDKK